MSDKYTVIVTFKAKTDQLQDFANLMNSVQNNLPAVEGCNGVRVLKHNDDATCTP